MKWMNNLYLGNLSGERAAEIKERIRAGKPALNTFVLFLPEHENNQLEMMDAKQLLQHYYRRSGLTVIGAAASHKEGLSLIARLTEEALKQTGSPLLRPYLEQKIREAGTEELP